MHECGLLLGGSYRFQRCMLAEAQEVNLGQGRRVCVRARSHSVLSDSVTAPTVAHQAPLSIGFPRQEFWSGFLFLIPGDLPDIGIEPTSPAGGFFSIEPPKVEALKWKYIAFLFF